MGLAYLKFVPASPIEPTLDFLIDYLIVPRVPTFEELNQTSNSDFHVDSNSRNQKNNKLTN